jgi:hypothetical protein
MVNLESLPAHRPLALTLQLFHTGSYRREIVGSTEARHLSSLGSAHDGANP